MGGATDRRRLRRRMFAGAAALATAVTAALALTGATAPLERTAVDLRFDARGSLGPSPDVVVVAIDDVTFDELDLRWPFPRSVHARLVKRLQALGAKAIAFDVQFTEPSEDPDEDDQLIDAIAGAGGVVLATTETTADGGSNVFGGDDVLAEIGARAGNALLPNDPGGVLRRVAPDVGGLRAFGIQAAEAFAERPIRPGGERLVAFRGPPGTMTTIPYSRVLRGEAGAEAVRGKLVVVGPQAPSLQDVHPTSTTGKSLMGGGEIQANVADTALRGFPLEEVPSWAGLAAGLLLAVLGPLLVARVRLWRAVGALVALGVALPAAAVLLFDGPGLVLPVAVPLVGLVAGGATGLATHALTAAFERERVRDMFARFVPEVVVDEVLAETGDGARLGGVARDATVLFSDLRGFTSFAELRDPEEVIGILNRYLSAMSDVLMEHGGTLVAYMGDGIMAVFGAPVASEDHAQRALDAARAMTGPAMDGFNAWLAEEHGGEPLRMGVGLNSGRVMSGNVGSDRRMEYTAIGDTTNTAARIEAMTKEHTCNVLASRRVWERLPEAEQARLREVGQVPVRGRTEPITLYAAD